MIKKLIQEISSHWNNKENFTHNEEFQSYSITISFEDLEFQSQELSAIFIELARGEYKARQEITLGSNSEITEQLGTQDFEELLKKRLLSLLDSIEDHFE